MTRPVLIAVLAAAVALSACARIDRVLRPTDGGAAPPGATPSPGPGVPELAAEVAAVVTAPPPPKAARTVEQFDTTTAAQRAAAEAKAPETGETRLGETVASLGDPSQPGFWIKSPLVKKAGSGRIEYPKTGKSAQVELIPLDGPATGGSQVSLAALRLLDAPLTDLPTLVVFAN